MSETYIEKKVGDTSIRELDAVLPNEVKVKREALERLNAIDAETGMNRLTRETLIAIADSKAPAKLVEAETKAASERLKLK